MTDRPTGLGYYGPAVAAATAGSGPLAPVVLGITAGLQLFLSLKNMFGPNPLNVPATQIVDAYERLLQQNVANFIQQSFGGYAPVTQVSQSDALSYFDQLFQQMVNDLSQIPDPNVVKRSVEDRLPDGMQYGGFTGNGKYNWFAYYRDPIAGAPPASTGDAVSQALAPVVSATGISPTMLALGVVGLVAAVAMTR